MRTTTTGSRCDLCGVEMTPQGTIKIKSFILHKDKQKASTGHYQVKDPGIDVCQVCYAIYYNKLLRRMKENGKIN